MNKVLFTLPTSVKNFIIVIMLYLLLLLFTNCSTTKRATPCRQCPHYSYTDAEILEYIKLNPFPAEIAYEKIDEVYFSVDK